jgi:DnaJ-class molecular chaperone
VNHYEHQSIPCPSCYGRGKLDCLQCEGSGRLYRCVSIDRKVWRTLFRMFLIACGVIIAAVLLWK